MRTRATIATALTAVAASGLLACGSSTPGPPAESQRPSGVVADFHHPSFTLSTTGKYVVDVNVDPSCPLKPFSLSLIDSAGRELFVDSSPPRMGGNGLPAHLRLTKGTWTTKFSAPIAGRSGR